MIRMSLVAVECGVKREVRVENNSPAGRPALTRLSHHHLVPAFKAVSFSRVLAEKLRMLAQRPAGGGDAARPCPFDPERR